MLPWDVNFPNSFSGGGVGVKAQALSKIEKSSTSVFVAVLGKCDWTFKLLSKALITTWFDL